MKAGLGWWEEEWRGESLSTGFGGEWVKGNTQWVAAMGGGKPINILRKGIIPLRWREWLWYHEQKWKSQEKEQV